MNGSNAGRPFRPELGCMLHGVGEGRDIALRFAYFTGSRRRGARPLENPLRYLAAHVLVLVHLLDSVHRAAAPLGGT
uniref:Uncharacterized protein n=1 Tax=Ralstonia syzygii R24 TaxID=907261 RepID=G3A752_9RALS|nr:hypothetical protein RALSY_40532 [Ralstonia syzygii R24]